MILAEDKMVPKTDECFILLKKYRVPEHVIRHSRVVHGVALCLCQALTRHGEELDQALVEAGSLLHDISKVNSLNTGENHPQAGALLLLRLGYPEVAEIVRQHVVLDEGTPQGPITEAAVVHYADKRVQHTTIVSLAERFRDLKERYGKSSAALAWLEDLEAKSLLLEEYIFQKLPIKPESLAVLCLAESR
jgi:putative nucleotidyltransferase with HDIG domain